MQPTPKPSTLRSRWKALSITWKIIIGLGTGALLIVMLAVALVVAEIFLLSNKDYTGWEAAKRSEGADFGKTTDQEGCVKEGLVRAKEFTVFNIKSAGTNQLFVEGCLKSSRAISRFCDEVPRSEWPGTLNDWEAQQCKSRGMDESTTGCMSVFTAKVNHCQGR